MRILVILFLLCLGLYPRTAVCDQAPSQSVLSLDECISLVLSKSSELAIARASGEQQEALVSSSRKDLLPSLSAYSSYTYKPDTNYYPDDEYGYGFEVEQPLYRGMSVVTGIKQAKINHKSAQLGIRKSINRLVFDVVNHYFSLLTAGKVEIEKQKAVARLKSHLDDTRAFFKAGLVARNKVLQSEVELAQGEMDLVAAQNKTKMARARLNILMQRPVDVPLQVKECGRQKENEFIWQNILEDTLANRVEVLQARFAVELAENDVILTRAPYLPTVSLSASYDKMLSDEPDPEHYPGWSRENNTVKAVASWKFWTWMKNRDEILVAKKNVDKAKLNLKQVIDEVTIEARKAYLHFDQAAKRIGVSEKVIEHARENYRINQARYKRQVGTTTEVLDAQALLTRAMTNYYDALYGLERAKVTVKKARGYLGQRYLNFSGDESLSECNPVDILTEKKIQSFQKYPFPKSTPVKTRITIHSLTHLPKLSALPVGLAGNLNF